MSHQVEKLKGCGGHSRQRELHKQKCEGLILWSCFHGNPKWRCSSWSIRLGEQPWKSHTRKGPSVPWSPLEMPGTPPPTICTKLFLHLLRWSCGLCLPFCLCGESHWLTCMCWTSLRNLGWILLGHGVWVFLYCWIQFAKKFVKNFCIYIQRYWSIIFLFGSIFVWFWYQVDGGFRASL